MLAYLNVVATNIYIRKARLSKIKHSQLTKLVGVKNNKKHIVMAYKSPLFVNTEV